MTKQRQGGFWSTLPGVITAITGLITAVAGLIAALYAAHIIGNTPTPAEPRVVEGEKVGPPVASPPTPYGIELTAVTDPRNAVLIADKAKSIAPAGAEIRLYKRITNKGTIASPATRSPNTRSMIGIQSWSPSRHGVQTLAPFHRRLALRWLFQCWTVCGC